MSSDAAPAAAATTTDASTEKTKVDGKGGAQYHCDYCRLDITNDVRIRCAECADFDLCLNCFAVGAHVAPHRPNHDYRVINNVKTPLYTEDWGADEELLLLEAIEMFGMGNWSDVADHVGSKNKTQCETHYDDVYLHSATAPLPDSSKALTRRMKKQDASSSSSSGDTEMTDGAVKLESGGSTAAVPSGRSSAKPTARAHGVTKPKPKSGLGHLVGFLPNRCDFDTEWENDAELILADMEFKDEDTKWERDLKLKVLEIYDSKLDGRIERKKFILERGLLERKEKKRSKEEREVYNNMRVFARFHSAQEHEAFLQGLLNEQRLRKKIEQLQNYRLQGIRTLADGELYEIERRKREGASGTGGKGTKAGLAASSAALAASSAAAAAAAGTWDAPGSGKGKKRTAEEDASAGGKKAKGASGTAVATQAAGSASASGLEWDVSKMAGHELLSAQERLLCTTLQLVPQHYLMIKERLIRECFTRGFLKENSAKQLIKIDINKTSKIFDFFVSVGWLNTGDLVKQSTAGTGAAAAAGGKPMPASSSSGAPSASGSLAAKKPQAAASSAAAPASASRPPVKSQ